MIDLRLGDCLEILPTLDAGSIDAIITDLPYGTTACSWDTVVPFVPMWAQVKRVLKPGGVFVTTASQPFTSALVMSNLEWFKYELIWRKRRVTGHLWAKYKPLKEHENIIVFCKKSPVYNPQMIVGLPHTRGPFGKVENKTKVYGNFSEENRQYTSSEYYPRSTIEICSEMQPEHSTQKPVALYEYLIRTYTNDGDTVLDFTMGSGTTGVACVQTGRSFIGIELEPKYFEIAQRRIAEAQAQMALPGVTA